MHVNDISTKKQPFAIYPAAGDFHDPAGISRTPFPERCPEDAVQKSPDLLLGGRCRPGTAMPRYRIQNVAVEEFSPQFSEKLGGAENVGGNDATSDDGDAADGVPERNAKFPPIAGEFPADRFILKDGAEVFVLGA